MGFMRDVINNIGYARMGLAVDVRDPFKKRVVEEELTKRGLKYCKGYFSEDSSIVYGICGGKKKDAEDFLRWYMKYEEHPRRYINHHKIFRTKILNVVVG